MMHDLTNDIILTELLRVHGSLALRKNISSVRVGQSALLDKDYYNAIASAMLSLGGVHAPIVQTVKLLRDPEYAHTVNDKMSKSLRIPGWGSDFVRGEPDEEFNKLDGMIKELDGTLYYIIERITAILHGNGKEIYPNAACYTAACGIMLEMRDEIVPYLLVRGRLDAWTDIYIQNKSDIM